MKVQGSIRCALSCLIGVLAVTGVSSSRVRAEQDHQHGSGALVAAVRESTERFKNVAVAESEGYFLQFGCVSGPDAGAMGMHFVNIPLVADGVLDAAHPEIVIYEPQPNGRLKRRGYHSTIYSSLRGKERGCRQVRATWKRCFGWKRPGA